MSAFTAEQLSLPKKFQEQVRVTDTCWIWMGQRSTRGYGRYYAGNYRVVQAHRLVYEALVGPIAPGLCIDHLCRNRICVNPAHMEQVTNAQNVLRGEGVTAKNAKKTHCPRGHEFIAENIYNLKSGRRACKICERARQRATPRYRGKTRRISVVRESK